MNIPCPKCGHAFEEVAEVLRLQGSSVLLVQCPWCQHEYNLGRRVQEIKAEQFQYLGKHRRPEGI